MSLSDLRHKFIFGLLSSHPRRVLKAEYQANEDHNGVEIKFHSK